MRPYYKYVFLQMRGKLKFTEMWSGCGGELDSSLRAGRLGESDTVELYVHPKMLGGVCTDIVFDYGSKQHKSVEEVVAWVAQRGQLLERAPEQALPCHR